MRSIADLNEDYGLEPEPGYRVTFGRGMGWPEEDTSLDAAARVNIPQNVRITFDHKVADVIRNHPVFQYLRMHRNAEELENFGIALSADSKGTYKRDNPMPDFPSDAVIAALAEVETDEKQLIETAAGMLQAYGGALYGFDFLATAALNRSLALCSGFRALIRERNLICAGALLRLQLDIALRFSAGFIVDRPHDFAIEVLGGKQINMINDRDGQRMTDRYLVTRMAKEHPWVKAVYEGASGYVHMSDIHIQSTLEMIDSETGIIGIKVSDHDQSASNDFYIDMIKTFRQCTRILLLHVEGWILAKNNPEAVALLKKYYKK